MPVAQSLCLKVERDIKVALLPERGHVKMCLNEVDLGMFRVYAKAVDDAA